VRPVCWPERLQAVSHDGREKQREFFAHSSVQAFSGPVWDNNSWGDRINNRSHRAYSLAEGCKPSRAINERRRAFSLTEGKNVHDFQLTF